VQFNDSSENATSLIWDFGDGSNSTEVDPVHEFRTAGTYTVNLTVTNENGTNSKLATINVLKLEPPVFPGCTNPPTDPDHDGRYEDINGNGRLDFNDVVIYYNNMDWIKENDLVAFFDYNKNSLIDFNDVLKLYNLISGDTKLEPPVANFTVDKTEGKVPLTVQFNDSSENATAWNWDFENDGVIDSNESNPVHVFTVPGTYTVNLTVINDDGTDSKLATINVLKLEPPVFPGCTNPPTDLDHDGHYEDINGNGRLDFDDVVVYYTNMDWIKENAPIAFFDYNKNSLIDFDDVVKLYNML
jgi:PKD repeat protein